VHLCCTNAHLHPHHPSSLPELKIYIYITITKIFKLYKLIFCYNCIVLFISLLTIHANSTINDLLKKYNIIYITKYIYNKNLQIFNYHNLNIYDYDVKNIFENWKKKSNLQ
jgi:hypothetical protein